MTERGEGKRERGRVLQGEFFGTPKSQLQQYLGCSCHQTENLERSFKLKDPITNPQGRPEKGLRCLKHIVQVFEETH